jgi:predicted outer membrane repeat protein
LTINNSVLNFNSAIPGLGNYGQHGCGGAIDNFKGNLVISNSELFNNSARFGGAINSYYANLTVINCKMTSNNADFSGGAICSNQGVQIVDSDTIAKFSGNRPQNMHHFFG